jgi:hypothetical protein
VLAFWLDVKDLQNPDEALKHAKVYSSQAKIIKAGVIQGGHALCIISGNSTGSIIKILKLAEGDLPDPDRWQCLKVDRVPLPSLPNSQ